MTQLVDNLILNPVEFTPELPEIDLRAGGIQIGPGAPNLGEATVNVERVRRLVGEGVTGRQLPTIECEIPILASIDRAITQAEAFAPLEAFVGDVQRGKIRWIQHDFKDVGGFAGSLATFVDNASLPKPYGGEVSELTLKLSRHPIWYATAEIEAGNSKTSLPARDLELVIAKMLGTAPGLIRLVITNEGAEDWRGCIVPIECDTYSLDISAIPKYEAQVLTPKGGAAVAEVSGAKVVKCPPLNTGWQTVFSSGITGFAGYDHMTHIGPRRPTFRLEDPSSLLDDVQWKLEWRQNGQAAWVQTMEASTPIVKSSPVIGGYQLIDMGECRPELPITGTPRWEWRLQARSLSGSGVQPLIRDAYLMTAEQWVRVADTTDVVIDGESIKSPAKVEDAAGVGTAVWTNPENANAKSGTDSVFATAVLEPAAVTHYLKATNFGFAIPPGSTILQIIPTVVAKGSIANVIRHSSVRIVKEGAIKSTVDKGNDVGWAEYESIVSFKWGDPLFGLTWTSAQINSSEFGVALSMTNAGGAKATAYVDSIGLNVAYAAGENLNRVCFASRSLEFSDTGIRRQHADDDEAWGELIPDGLDLQAPVPGQANQHMRVLIVPSAGDFDSRADPASVKLSAKLYYRPAYLSAREAA